MKKRVYISLFSERATRMLLRGKLLPLLLEHYDVGLVGPPDWLKKEFPYLEIIGLDTNALNCDLFIATSNHLAPTHYWDTLGLASMAPSGNKIMIIQHFFDAIFHHQIVIPDIYCCWGEWFANELSSECLRQFWLYTFFDNLRGLVNLSTKDVGTPREKFRVTGSLNHDFLFDAPIKPKEQFCDELGLDPKKPIIMNTPIGMEKAECHNDLEAIARICRDIDAQLIFSPHPMDYNALENYKNTLNKIEVKHAISIDPEMKDCQGMLDYFDPKTPFCMKRYLPKEQHRMANFFTHVDVMTSIGNTSNLEAMIYDTPAVINAIKWQAGQQDFKKWGLAKYYGILENFDCVDIVYNDVDYKKKVIEAIENPAKRSEQRKKAVRALFHEVDGNAYLRVFDAIKKLVED